MKSVKYGVQVAAVCCVSLVIFMVYVSNIGCGCTDPEDEKLTVQIGLPEVSARLSGEEVTWDATLHINKVTPKDEKARWSKVRVVVKSADGNVLNPASESQPYDPSTITDGGVGSANVQFWIEDDTGDDNVGASDNILITGMDAMLYEGALVQIMTGGHLIGDTTLPTDFP